MIAEENAANNGEKRNRDTTATQHICVTKTRKSGCSVRQYQQEN